MGTLTVSTLTGAILRTLSYSMIPGIKHASASENSNWKQVGQRFPAAWLCHSQHILTTTAGGPACSLGMNKADMDSTTTQYERKRGGACSTVVGQEHMVRSGRQYGAQAMKMLITNVCTCLF
eukprot:410761-Pelagomonas_calceolata.AAC.3